MSHNLVALHGFLGQPGFWDEVVDKIEDNDDANCWTPNLHNDSEFVDRSWLSWPDQFETWLQNNSATAPIVLVGYSMGGRLALEFARRRPNWISHLILISTRGGAPPAPEMKEREAWEAQWLKRFQSEDVESWLKDWNGQPLFKGSESPLELRPKDISRDSIIDTFSGWSLSSQDSEWSDLGEIEVPTLWLFGDRDEKYVSLMDQTQKSQPNAKCIKVSGAGHRIPLEQPKKVVEHIKDFLSKG